MTEKMAISEQSTKGVPNEEIQRNVIREGVGEEEAGPPRAAKCWMARPDPVALFSRPITDGVMDDRWAAPSSRGLWNGQPRCIC